VEQCLFPGTRSPDRRPPSANDPQLPSGDWRSDPAKGGEGCQLAFGASPNKNPVLTRKGKSAKCGPTPVGILPWHGADHQWTVVGCWSVARKPGPGSFHRRPPVARLPIAVACATGACEPINVSAIPSPSDDFFLLLNHAVDKRRTSGRGARVGHSMPWVFHSQPSGSGVLRRWEIKSDDGAC